MTAAFVFPGQGSQAVGMGKALAEAFAPARAVFDEVDAALGEKLTATMWEGPAEKLTLTENAQPALMAVSVAVMRVLEAEAGVDIKRDAKFVAGHSLGEYSALAAAGAFSITDAARLLRIRGNAMQKAVPVGTGAMAALLGMELDAASAVAAEAAQGEVCQAANDNGGGQVVVSGNKSAVERAVEIAVERPVDQLRRVDGHVDGRGEQGRLGAEVVVQERGIHPRPLGDRAHRRAVVAACPELGGRGRQDPLAGIARSAARPTAAAGGSGGGHGDSVGAKPTPCQLFITR